jgi:glycosyltransferase involved in cell wall biosynthesis
MPVDISIIIPLYNKEKYIERVLSCIESQTFLDWECIILDDGSTDESGRIAKDFIFERGNRWRYVYQENSGQAAARNAGINLSEGKYIAFLDADDLWPKSKLTTQYEALELHENCVLALSPFVIFDVNSILPRVVSHTSTEKMLNGWVTMLGFGGAIESVGLIRKSSLEEGLRFDESLTTSSGLDFTLMLVKLGQICFLKDIGLIYRISDGQWHSNSLELHRNLNIVRMKHQGDWDVTLSKYHYAYSFWVEKRTKGWWSYFAGFFNSILCLNYIELHMFFSLLIRNVKARISGIIRFKYLSKLIATVD